MNFRCDSHPDPSAQLARLACLILLLASHGSAQTVGSLSYQMGGEGVYAYDCYPDLTGGVVQGRKADERFHAELWWSPSLTATAGHLQPVAGSRRTGTSSGLIIPRSKLEIPGTFGGDTVTLQVRYWEHGSGRWPNWDAALRANACRGYSPLFQLRLAGVDEFGTPVLPPPSESFWNKLKAFGRLLPYPRTTGPEMFFGYCISPKPGSGWLDEDSIPLSVTTPGDGSLALQWNLSAPLVTVYVDDRPISLGTTATTEIRLTGLSAGRHRVRVERSLDIGNGQFLVYGFASSAFDVLPANRLPRIERQPHLTVVGGAARFEAQATGAAPLAYQWYRNGVMIGGATDPVLVIGNADPSQAGYYSVQVSSEYGSVSSESVYLSTTQSLPRSITLLPLSPSAYAPAGITQVELWAGPEPDALQRVDSPAWPLEGSLHTLPTVSPDRDAYLQLRAQIGENPASIVRSSILRVPASEEEVEMLFRSDLPKTNLQLQTWPSIVAVEGQPLSWASSGVLAQGVVSHQLRKDGVAIPATVGDLTIDGSGVFTATHTIAAGDRAAVGSYTALVSHGREIWLSPPVNLRLWKPGKAYPFPPSPFGRRPQPQAVWTSRSGVYEAESSINLRDWTSETLQRTYEPGFEFHPVWRGQEPHRFYRVLVRE